MKRLGIRALKQNASAVVSEVVAGNPVTITDRGRPVAQMFAMKESPLQGLIATGRAKVPRRSLKQLPPAPRHSASLTKAILKMRRKERY